MLINNFSIGLNEWYYLDDITYFSVDVTDDICSVSTSGTYFMLNEVPTLTTYSGITDGYRFYCSNPVISGGLIVTIHAENDCSGVEEIDYNLLFGYRAEFTDYIDWGPNKEIVVWSRASNTVECPNTESFATFFETKELESRDLSAFIYPTGYGNLGAEIYPQSKYFLPGYTYTITVSGIKDFSGNQMQPIVFSFTIAN